MLAKNEFCLLRFLQERFRCPDEFLKYRLTGELSQDSGFFELGNGAICYGRSVGAIHRTRPKPPALGSGDGPECGAGELLLRFDPDEVIRNLTLERYPGCRLNETEKALKNLYYRFRPLTSRGMRRSIQKLRAAKLTPIQFPNWPVDTSVEDICEALLLRSMDVHGVDRIPFIWFWPNGADGCVAVTHDVETVEGRDFCEELMDMDELFGIKSSFQIVPEKRYTVSETFLDRFRDRGFEICVQDLNHDGRLFDDLEKFRGRAAAINSHGRRYGAKGFRSAVLYRRPEWLEYLDFSFDMSIPNVAHLDPQRGGCCTVMPYFIGKIVELPLTTIQDYTLFRVLDERSDKSWKLQLMMILARNGLATFLVHPDYVLESETRTVYKSLLKALNDVGKEQHIWFALPGMIDSWWRSRNQLSIVRDGSSWRIVGKGAEQARLAFARNAEGRLTYELAEDSSSKLTFASTARMKSCRSRPSHP